MKVSNLNGNKNQFIYTDNEGTVIFQSYNSIIAKLDNKGNVILDSYYWNYSPTTSKYRNIFLEETTKETEAKIKAGIYKLENLN
jgi:hypothetical protein